MAEFKDMLKYYRESRGYSQTELAKLIHVSPAAIGNWEQGTRFPQREQEESLADLFNVSLDNLRGIDTEKRYIPKVDQSSLLLLEKFSKLSDPQKQIIINTIDAFLGNNDQ